jgi:outer membrane protein assembly factor BamD (BamD/ComL family)
MKRPHPVLRPLISLVITLALTLPLAAQSTAQRAEALYRQGQAAEKAGDPAAAQKAYTEALKAHPSHPHARYSLGQLKITGPALAAKGREAKFGAVMVPELKLDQAPLKESLEALQVLVEKQSKETVTPNFILQDPKDTLAGVKITLVLKNTPAKAVLQYILDQAGAKARYDEHAIVITPH